MVIATRWGQALVFLLLAFAPASTAHAQWTSNGNPVCVYAGEQNNPATVHDGAGGAFIAWQDTRLGPSDVYAQRLTASGGIATGWPADGLALCTAAGDQKSIVIAGDGAGGVFVAWEDYRAGGADGNIYALRITSTGTLASGWPAAGLALCTAAGGQGYPTLSVSGSDAIVAWQDDRSGLHSDIYAQRVSAGGAIQWETGGVALCNLAANQMFPSIVSDGAGGAIVAWQDRRNGGSDVYAQRVSDSGAIAWTANGEAVCTFVDDQLAPRMCGDGAGGAVVIWDDYRDYNADVYAQRVDPAGAGQWTPGGVALCTDLAEQYSAAPIPDGSGGAIVPWSDFRGGSGDLYAQRVTGAGVIASGWPANGLAVCTAAGDQFDPVGVSDGFGGALITWDDARGGTAAVDIYAQRITSSGGVPSGWSQNGTLICNAANNQLRPAIASGGGGDAIIAWYDERSGPADLYARRITASGSGTVDVPEGGAAELGFAPPAPNPMGPYTLLRFRLPGPAPVRLEVLDLAGRAVKVLLDEAHVDAGSHSATWDGRDEAGARVCAGLYFVAIRSETISGVRKLTVLR